MAVTSCSNDNTNVEPPAPLVDLAHLSRYTLGDRALEQEVLQLFAAEAPATLARLKCADSDRAWREAAHTIKGSARAVGAWPVARLAERAETLMTLEERQTAILHLHVAIEDTARYIESLCAAGNTGKAVSASTTRAPGSA
jgi:HPt (histidine-containing phosphotransfer) domain-containing protein